MAHIFEWTINIHVSGRRSDTELQEAYARQGRKLQSVTRLLTLTFSTPSYLNLISFAHVKFTYSPPSPPQKKRYIVIP